MKVAVAQIACALGDVAANVAKLRENCVRAKRAGAELIVFPELADTGYAMDTIREHATPWTEGAVPALQAVAAEETIAVICGVAERNGGAIYNTQVMIDAAGSIIGAYRKTHLFGAAPAGEQACFTRGSELKTVPYANFRLGLSICYDLRFPEVYRTLACQQSADVLVVSSAWPFPRAEHFRILALARAIENQSYLIVANRVGTDAGITFCGSSAIIDPAGVIVASAAPDREEIIYGDISADVLRATRNRMPIFADRRADLYG